jgi:hypothetical protein
MLGLKPQVCTIGYRNDRMVKLVRLHRERQEKLLNIYRKNETKFLKELKEVLLEPDMVASEVAGEFPKDTEGTPARLLHG